MTPMPTCPLGAGRTPTRRFRGPLSEGGGQPRPARASCAHEGGKKEGRKGLGLTGETRLTGTAFRTPSGEPELPSVPRARGPTPRCAPPTERCPHARAGPGPPWPGGSRPPGRAPRSPSPTERRILEAIWERTYPSPVPWTIRGVARELGLQPMQVFRVCKRHHLSGPALRDVLPDAPFSVTVAGLYLRPPVIAAVFHRGARASEPGPSSTGRDTPARGEKRSREASRCFACLSANEWRSSWTWCAAA